MVEFELDRDGVKELLNSPEMTAILADYASATLKRLPKGYGMSTGATSQRAKATVGTRSAAAASNELKNNSLLKAL